MLKTDEEIDPRIIQKIANIREAIQLLYVAIDLERDYQAEVAADYQIDIVVDILEKL
jgi:CO dehydrogenase/acetyl-CoA synthase delta subunit